MKFVSIIFYLLLFVKAGFAQKIETYRQQINKAELCIIDSNYTKALTFYQNAFTNNNFILSKDYYNAAVCAVKTNDYVTGKALFYKLARTGYDINELRNKKGLKDFVESNFFSALLKEQDTLKLNSSIDIFLKNKLDTMLQDDQYFRNKNPRSYTKSKYANIIKTIDSINSFELLNIIKIQGFPNEFLIGHHKPTQLNSNLSWEIILIHQGFGATFRVVDFSPYLLEGIKDEKLLQHNMLYLYRGALGYGPKYVEKFGNTFVFHVKLKNGRSKYAYKKESIGDEELHNQNRLSYNLESVEDHRKKVIYWIQKNKDFIFDFQKGTDTEEDFPEEIANTVNELIYF